MKALLTRSVVSFLVLEGYTYCLSKTSNISKAYASVCITLTPVKRRPDVRKLPEGYDTYFNIMKEPLLLAEGVDDTEVIVNVEHVEIAKYQGSISFL
ncbi:hypothetical protein IDJ77_24985 [Mucilaginibacter sp. ZT4R22]|uniref:Uncharacterized protein n=1 Tax=Mucilaginibacter pankratovii TaxID=2772110 RepID=A0ABR7WXS1_9SPHI|nr:hypothetical protein [Mucilaginibacter pankratovii]MBD1367090.1 hypothetical protein [Mucilaginibacter pankratovii]